MKRVARNPIQLVLAMAVVAAPIASAAREIAAPDVYARVSLVDSDIELIRFVMAKPKNEQPEIRVTGAAPREVYFQALTMFRKANRLSFELTREVAAAPEPPGGTFHPADVMAVVDAALERISHVKAKLKITNAPDEPPADPSKTPTDVFRAIVRQNRQLNLLLDEPFAPADVFREVTLAVGYAARLRARFPGDRIPEPPELVVGRQPRDVYRRLIECFSIIREVAKRSNLEVLDLQPIDDQLGHVTPSDVYDIASLLVSELAFLHSRLKDAKPPRRVYHPGRKFPSDVDQRAGILERQLLELRGLVESNPDWLLGPQVDR